jgi:hypothetical protein
MPELIRSAPLNQYGLLNSSEDHSNYHIMSILIDLYISHMHFLFSLNPFNNPFRFSKAK